MHFLSRVSGSRKAVDRIRVSKSTVLCQRDGRTSSTATYGKASAAALTDINTAKQGCAKAAFIAITSSPHRASLLPESQRGNERAPTSLVLVGNPSRQLTDIIFARDATHYVILPLSGVRGSMKTKVAIVLLAMLGGCVSQPIGPTVTVLPGPGKPFDRFAEEEAFCRDFARWQVAGAPAQANSKSSAARLSARCLAEGSAQPWPVVREAPLAQRRAASLARVSVRVEPHGRR
jgi:hypothetical protein